MKLLDRVLDTFRGKAITIPPLDGAFRPNTMLDDAPTVASVTRPDDVVRSADGRIIVATGQALRIFDVAIAIFTVLTEFDATVTALAASPDGSLLAGLDDGRLMLCRDGNVSPLSVPGLSCPTAITFLDPVTVLVTQGSKTRRPSEWARDLLEQGADGALWSIEVPSGRARQLAEGLAFPFGLTLSADKAIVIVSESWRNRLVRIPLGGGRVEAALADLPGYPARIVQACGSGYWLALFAPRNRLVEFVLNEPHYRRAMLQEVPPEYWVAPTLSPSQSFLEPMQCGSLHTMGVSKAWAPSRSFGLVARLDANLRPIASYHSRTNGERHGITGVLDLGNDLLVAVKGADAVIRLEGVSA